MNRQIYMAQAPEWAALKLVKRFGEDYALALADEIIKHYGTEADQQIAPHIIANKLRMQHDPKFIDRLVRDLLVRS